MNIEPDVIVSSEEFNSDRVHKLYIVYCGRPADPGGLEFWQQRLAQFDATRDALCFFGKASDEGDQIDRSDPLMVINSLFANAFGRKSTDREAAYFATKMAVGDWAPVIVANAIIENASEEDWLRLNEKLERAKRFTALVASGAREYGEAQLNEAKAYLRTQPTDCTLIQNPIGKPILIGTHHKAGTNWLASIFRKASDCYEFEMYEGESPESFGSFDIVFQDHSVFTSSLLKETFRGVHMIRDPRDVVISGCFYHQRSNEPWLHIKRQRYGGLSYQEKLNSYETLSEKLLFEMEHISVLTIKDMWAWDYQSPSFYEVKYEDLVQDSELTQFREMFSFLGFSDTNFMHEMLSIAHDNSLFSGKVDTSHVRSGAGQQWPEYFDKKLKRRFLELFGSVLIELGYEDDHSWADLDETFSANSPECTKLSIYDVLYHPDDEEL